MPRFDLEILDACAAVDAEFGEEIVWIPRAESQDRTAPDGADPKRPVLTLKAVFVERDAPTIEPNSYDARQARRPGTASVYLWVEIAPGALRDALAALGLKPPFAAKAGDQVARRERRETYVVAAAPIVSVNGVLKARLNRL